MEDFKYITFNIHDIIEALEDLYKKKTGEKLDIMFDNSNREIRNIRSINIRKSISTSSAEVKKVEGTITWDHTDDMAVEQIKSEKIGTL